MNKIIERKQKQINKDRRRFLDMLTKGGISTSILRASPIAGGLMASRFAEAQTTAKKLVMIYHPNGAPKDRWAPGSSVATDPLQAHMGNIALREMKSAGTSHGRLDYAAGRNYNSPATQSTFNMQVAQAIGHLTSYSSMELGVHTKNTGGDINVLNGTKIPLEDSPTAVLNRFFGAAPPPPSTGGGGGPTIYDRRLKVAQANIEALDALQRKLGAFEKEKLDFQMNSLKDLESEIQRAQMAAEMNSGGNTGGSGGGSCSAPSLAYGSTPLETYRAQGSIAAKALACGITNVVSIQFNETQASWFGNDGSADAVNYAGDHHSAIHSGGFERIPDLIAYMNKGVAHLISELKKESVFNDTVVVVFSEMGDPSHTNEDMPVIVASGIDRLQTGYRKDSGSMHWGVFGDVARLMGLESEIGGMIGDYGRGGHVFS